MQTEQKQTDARSHWPVIIIGAGFGGIGMAIKLREAGFDDFRVLERGPELGGTWQRNTYPGAACDVPSSLYCYSFAPNPNWQHKYGTQQEIHDYLKATADRFDVRKHMQFNSEVQSAVFDGAQNLWHIDTGTAQFSADVLISSVGVFDQAHIPNLPGLDAFRGKQFHSLHWDHQYKPHGERIAVIGTGASAVQFIPEIQPLASKLTVFQRTPPWIVPRLDRRIAALEKQLYRRLPMAQKLSRRSWYTMIESFGLPGFVNTAFRYPFEALGRMQLRRQVKDVELRRKLTPDYMIGCKRAVFSDNYYPALCQPNVQVVSSGIERINAHSIQTKDGQEHAVDSIIFGTGFAPMPALHANIHGLDGRSLAERHSERPQSYWGVAMSGFPNFFTILGQFGAGGNQSAIFWMEGQFKFIIDALQARRREGIARMNVSESVQQAFVDDMHHRSRNGTWLNGGCTSYYTNDKGLNAGLYPNWSFEYRQKIRRWKPADFELQYKEGAHAPV